MGSAKSPVRASILVLAALWQSGCLSSRHGFDSEGAGGPCSSATAGSTRWNDGLGIPEVCDGDTWVGLNGPGGVGVSAILALMPGDQISFVVAGAGNPAHSEWVTAAVSNIGSESSAPLGFRLSNPRNFEVDQGECAATQLAPGASCEFSLRARASATATFDGFLVVEADNAPSVPLSGRATLDCPVGMAQAGGVVAACAEGGYYLIADPGGCDGVTPTPDCSAIIDRHALTWGPTDVSVGVQDSADGPSNTASILSISGSEFPAAAYCGALMLNGYDDWYLPAVAELSGMLASRDAIPGFRPDGSYWSSTEASASGTARIVHSVAGEAVLRYKDESHWTRCARRDYATAPVQHDPCQIGSAAPGGTYVACGSAYDLVVLPSGCDGSTAEPACAGGPDSVSRSWGPSPELVGPASAGVVNGAQNTVNLQALADFRGIGTHAAAEYCMALVYDGFDDWHLPALEELRTVVDLHRSTGQVDMDGIYWTSTETSEILAAAVASDTTASDSGGKRTPYLARCVRRHGLALPTPTVDPAGCSVGAPGGGGVYFSCGTDVNLVASRGGCASHTGPCDGGGDAIRLTWGVDGPLVGADSMSDGARNTQLLAWVPGDSIYPAAEFCSTMLLEGFDDWFLPSLNQLELMLQGRNSLGGFVSDLYWSSTERTSSTACAGSAVDGLVGCSSGGDGYYRDKQHRVRCMRAQHTGPEPACTAGTAGPGGLYAVCAPEYNLVVLPSGCDGTTDNPICAGVDDGRIMFPFGGDTADGALSHSDGPTNTAALDAVAGVNVRPAAEYCARMVFGGYDDWYQPAIYELSAVMLEVPALGGFAAGLYWSSTVGLGVTAAYSANQVSAESGARGTPLSVRCVRRD